MMDLSSYVSQLKDKLSIVDVIGKVVHLKKAGRNFIGLCPFHGEKTPSFTVSEEKGIFFCFGCKTGGDLIQFYMRFHQVSFKEAVDTLSLSAGISSYQWTSEPVTDSKDQYMVMMEEVKKYYYDALPNSKEGSAYVHQRGIPDKLIEQYCIGFAPADSKPLLSLIHSKKIDKEKALYLGLLHQDNQGQYYTYFRDRIIFPIFNQSGKTIGFGGRSMLPEQQPKYLNSPDHVLFHKGQQLYGLFQAKSSIQQEKKVIITEGYMDVLTLVRFGFPFTVATLGTALTKEHAKLLSRLDAEIFLCFDQDEAGEKAIEKAMQVLLSQGMDARIIRWSGSYKDPDEVLTKEGADFFQDSLVSAKPMLDYYWNRMLENKPVHPSEIKEKTNKMFEMIVYSSEAIVHDQVIKKMAYDLHVLPNILWDQFRFKQQQEKSGMIKKTAVLQKKDFDGFIPSLEGEKLLLKALLDPENDWGKTIFNCISEDDFSSQFNRRVFHFMQQWYPESLLTKINALSPSEMEEDIVNGIMELSILDSSFINRDSIEQVLRKTSDNKRKKISKSILQKIKEAEANGDDNTCRSLREELKKIV